MMKHILYIFLLYCMAACTQSEKAKPHLDISNESLAKMDIIEKFFNNDNWMEITGRDTLYYYFSRNNNTTKVFNYQLLKGDSINTKLSEIKFLNDSLSWEYNDTVRLFLSGADQKKLEWKKISRNSPVTPYIFFDKKDSIHIDVIRQNRQFSLIKTLPLSAFLIRSRYDYLHGTRFAFSDTGFNK